MPLFKKSKSSNNPPPVRSVHHPAFAPPGCSIEPAYSSDRRFADYRFTHEGSNYHPVSQPPQEPKHPSLHRSQSQRQPHQSHRDRAFPVVAAEDPQPRRSKRDRFSSRFLERSVSVKGKLISHPTSPSLDTTEKEPPAFSEAQSPVTQPLYEARFASLAHQQRHQRFHPESSQQPPASAQPQSHFIPRPLNTDPSLLENFNRPLPPGPAPESPCRPSGQSQSRIQQDLVLNARPPSQQTCEPLSPVRSQNYPDAMQQAQGQQTANDRPQGSQQDSSNGRGSAAQNMPEPGRNTPTPNRTREDPGEIDVQALLQKHEELQSKYSKVKRYYFDKEAQVQHLQNTVAHQRMAVSRTVLDDNEYANRFQRLDGAIKDLAFSVRKDWRGVPPWLHGLVTDDAVATGTKEMTAMGRAVISRWLVEEVFQKHFHPGLEPGLSLQLKNIEMNLRRQQMRPATDEDRDNAIARLSNWRRTTFDGLGDMLADARAQEHREELIEHLTPELASFLGTQLHDPALPGLEAGVRMIVENTINIAEKIPLEARDVCVEYLPPNIAFVDGYMKVEGQLPPLNRQPPPPADQEADDSAAAEADSSPNSNSTGAGDGTSSAPREPRKKSVFGALSLMGRKSANENSRPTGGQAHEDKGECSESGPARIRFASFLTVEVRGKGPAMVLVKAPVWLVE